MIIVEVCSHCKKKACGLEKGVDIYEALKSYESILKEKQIEFIVKECGCLGGCKGPVVKVNEKIYTEVNIYTVQRIINGLLEEKL